jgi:hypothetical protein
MTEHTDPSPDFDDCSETRVIAHSSSDWEIALLLKNA